MILREVDELGIEGRWGANKDREGVEGGVRTSARVGGSRRSRYEHIYINEGLYGSQSTLVCTLTPSAPIVAPSGR